MGATTARQGIYCASSGESKPLALTCAEQNTRSIASSSCRVIRTYLYFAERDALMLYLPAPEINGRISPMRGSVLLAMIVVIFIETLLSSLPARSGRRAAHRCCAVGREEETTEPGSVSPSDLLPVPRWCVAEQLAYYTAANSAKASNLLPIRALECTRCAASWFSLNAWRYEIESANA
jgi:hypothetical protein